MSIDRRMLRSHMSSPRSVFVACVGVCALVILASIGMSLLPRESYQPSPVDPVASLGQEVENPGVLEIPAGPLTEQTNRLLTETASGSASIPDDAVFVSPELGTEGNDGLSAETPLPSLQAAFNEVNPGQTILMMDGVYRELAEPGIAHYVLKRGGEPSAWVRIQNAPGHRPEIVATDGNGLELRASYVEVSGLSIRGEGFTEASEWGAGILARSSHHIRLVANRISGMPMNGVSMVECSNLTLLENVIFENSFWSSAQGSGISIWHSVNHGFPPGGDGYHDRIIGNMLYRNENRTMSRWRDYKVITDGNGIIIDQNHETNYDGRTLVANNVIFDNGGRGVMVFESSFVDVMHNTTFHNGRTSELDGGPSELAAARTREVRFLNNLSWARLGYPALLVADSVDVSSGGNVFVSSHDKSVSSSDDLQLVSDPGLLRPSIDEQVADFRPIATSPLIAHAQPVRPSLSYDIVGTLRDAGSATVGAYEVAGGQP